MVESESISRTCFVVAAHNADIGAVKQALERKAISCVTVGDIADIGRSLDSLLAVIKDCDFACVLFTDADPLANVMFEAGLALGLGKPTLIITTGEPRLPFDLGSVSVARLEGSRSSALDAHLDAFLRTVPQKSAKRKARKRRSGNDADTAWALDRLTFFETAPNRIAAAFDFERFVEELFERWGYSVTSAPGPDYGADMAVWSADVKRKLGNPILVEVKMSHVDQQTVDHVAGRLTRMIRDGQGSMALLVSSRINAAAKQSIGSNAPILHLTPDELIRSLSADNLLDVLVSNREEFLKRKR
jgi:hypothetical protein